MASLMDSEAPAPLGDGPSAEPPSAHVYRVMCVDDEPNIVAALRRLFRGTGYSVVTATSGAEALELMAQQPVDLLISDMRMPGMDGAQLLEQVRARWPDTVRVLLTGYADIKSTIAAINSGEVFRYITKPWDDAEILGTARQVFERQSLEREKHRLEALLQVKNAELLALNASLEEKVQARTSELSLLTQKLKKNYLTSIKVFSNLMEWRGGSLSGHARRVVDLTRRTGRSMGLVEAEQQDLFIASLMHDIGQISLSDHILARPVGRLTEEELVLYRKHPVLGEQALMPLEDMQGVAALIRSHHERHDGHGYPDGLVGDAIPVGARILAVADTYDDLLHGHLSSGNLGAADARAMIARGRGTQFHPEVVDVFLQVLLEAAVAVEAQPVMTDIKDLRSGMALATDLVSAEGVVLLAADHVLSADLIRRIQLREGREGMPLKLPIKKSSWRP
nr:HD domain-containing phosphohydrolase [uncultured Albidiferax sp.]